MVLMEHKTKSDSESDTEASEGELSDEEVNDMEHQRQEISPDLPEPPSSSDTSSTPEPPDSDEESLASSIQTAGDEHDARSPYLKSSLINLGLTNVLNISFLVDRYGKRHNSSLGRGSISSGHITKFTSEINGSFAGANTPADNWMPMEDNTRTNRETIATECDLRQTSDHKEESDDSTKEKSDGVSEKDQLAVEASSSAARVTLLSGPELTDCDLFVVPDSPLSPDYDCIPMKRNEMANTPTELTDCQWTRHLLGEIHPVTDEADSSGSLAEASGGLDEAAALPASFLFTSLGTVEEDEDQYFALDTVIAAPALSCTSAAEEDISSPNIEPCRIKEQNRQRAYEQRRYRPLARTTELSIQVPTEKVGRIVGKRGKRIKEIESISGAKIKIEDRQSKKALTKITLTGTEEQIWTATIEINIIARNFKPAEPGQLMTLRVTTTNKDELTKFLINIKNHMLEGGKKFR